MLDSSENSPLDLLSPVALVARAIQDIEESNDDCRDVLLFDLLRAAWPDPLSQNQ
jgi:hypothetical protein